MLCMEPYRPSISQKDRHTSPAMAVNFYSHLAIRHHIVMACH